MLGIINAILFRPKYSINMKITVKFRIKDGKPFSIETLSGHQFRCGICGEVFFNRSDIEKHLEQETHEAENLKFPELNKNISVSVLYTEDVKDITNPMHSRVKAGESILNLNRE